MGEFEKAQEVYQSLLGKTFSGALAFFQKAWDIIQKVLPTDHLDRILFLNSISVTYQVMGNLSAALPYAEKALEVPKSMSVKHPNVALIYCTIAAIHMGKDARRHFKFSDLEPSINIRCLHFC